MRPDDLYASPNALAGDYSRFRVAERLLLTGHSHQAWPDCGFAAQQRAWLDAAEFVDDKWPLAFARAEEVRHGFGRLLGEPDGDIALGQNTLELVVRFVSALPLQPFQFGAFEGKRRVASFGFRFDYTLQRLQPAEPIPEWLLPLIEKELSPFHVRPHWGKLFTISPADLRSRYPRLRDFVELCAKYDPHGKFRNDFLNKNVFLSKSASA